MLLVPLLPLQYAASFKVFRALPHELVVGRPEPMGHCHWRYVSSRGESYRQLSFCTYRLEDRQRKDVEDRVAKFRARFVWHWRVARWKGARAKWAVTLWGGSLF